MQQTLAQNTSVHCLPCSPGCSPEESPASTSGTVVVPPAPVADGTAADGARVGEFIDSSAIEYTLRIQSDWCTRLIVPRYEFATHVAFHRLFLRYPQVHC